MVVFRWHRALLAALLQSHGGICPLGLRAPRMLSHSQRGDCPLAPPLPFAAQAINYVAHLMQPVVERC